MAMSKLRGGIPARKVAFERRKQPLEPTGHNP